MLLRRTPIARLWLSVVVYIALSGLSLRAQDAGQPQNPPRVSGDLPEGWGRRGDTAVTTIGNTRFAWGIQYRVLYNGSNLPGPAGTTPDNTTGYDFFRQRVRVNFEVAANETTGAFAQVEFRGGWGGSSPSATDPRGAEPALNPFNRISDRGLRYTYLYWKPSSGQQVMAGILPLSDEFGDTLFSADWDWNAAGVSWLGSAGRSRWRLGALNMIEGVGSSDRDTISNNGTMIMADFARRYGAGAGSWAVDWGGHLYGLVVADNLPLGGTQSFWVGPSATLRKDRFALNLFGIVNSGDLGVGVLNPDGTVVSGFTGADARSHTGAAFRAEVDKSFDGFRLRGQVLHTTGDREGEIKRRFMTPMSLFGTSGYWGYTHIFTANGPSDVNDFGLDIGNRGAGLTTAQVMGSVSLHQRVGLDLASGWFRARQARNAGRDLGHEFSSTLGIQLSGPLRLEAGAAVANLGNFFGNNTQRIYEVFSRLQLQY